MIKKKMKYSLRERKHAKTKIALTRAFIKRLDKDNFEDISIKEICDQVDVSEATFFNYFPRKIDVMDYYHELFFLKLNWMLLNKSKKADPISKIESILFFMADEMPEPNVFFKFIAMYTNDICFQKKKVPIAPVEKYYTYPELANIETTEVMDVDTLIMGLVKEAIQKNFLKKSLNSNDVYVAIHSIIIGVPFTLELDFSDLKRHYKKQIAWLWQALKP